MKESEQNLDLSVVGSPGSGKSSIAERFALRNQWQTFNMGDTLRYIALDSGHDMHEVVSWHLNQGVLIEQEVLEGVLSRELSSMGNKRVVFDGAVRDQRQLEKFDEVLEGVNRNYDSVIVLATMTACIQRLLTRGRGDDYDEMIARRIKDFREKTLPAISVLEQRKHINVYNEKESDATKAIRQIEEFIGIHGPGTADIQGSHLNRMYGEVHGALEYYDTAWRREIRQRMFLDFVQNHAGRDFLDLGCRDGLLTQEMSKGRNITAVDIDEEALRRYRIKYSDQNPTVYHHDLNYPLDLPDNSQDIVVAGEVVEHLSEPEKLVSEVFRVLRRGGIFIGSTPNAFKYDKRIRLLLGQDPKEFSDRTHMQYYSQSSLISLLRGKFEDVMIFPYVGDKGIDFLTRIRADGFIWKAEKNERNFYRYFEPCEIRIL